MEIIDKIVDFVKYCKTCKHCDIAEYEDPCNECLDNPTNVNSKRPINYKEDEKRVKEEEKKAAEAEKEESETNE